MFCYCYALLIQCIIYSFVVCIIDTFGWMMNWLGMRTATHGEDKEVPLPSLVNQNICSNHDSPWSLQRHRKKLIRNLIVCFISNGFDTFERPLMTSSFVTSMVIITVLLLQLHRRQSALQHILASKNFRRFDNRLCWKQNRQYCWYGNMCSANDNTHSARAQVPEWLCQWKESLQ